MKKTIALAAVMAAAAYKAEIIMVGRKAFYHGINVFRNVTVNHSGVGLVMGAKP